MERTVVVPDHRAAEILELWSITSASSHGNVGVALGLRLIRQTGFIAGNIQLKICLLLLKEHFMIWLKKQNILIFTIIYIYNNFHKYMELTSPK